MMFNKENLQNLQIKETTNLDNLIDLNKVDLIGVNKVDLIGINKVD